MGKPRTLVEGTRRNRGVRLCFRFGEIEFESWEGVVRSDKDCPASTNVGSSHYLTTFDGMKDLASGHCQDPWVHSLPVAITTRLGTHLTPSGDRPYRRRQHHYHVWNSSARTIPFDGVVGIARRQRVLAKRRRNRRRPFERAVSLPAQFRPPIFVDKIRQKFPLRSILGSGGQSGLAGTEPAVGSSSNAHVAYNQASEPRPTWRNFLSAIVQSQIEEDARSKAARARETSDDRHRLAATPDNVGLRKTATPADPSTESIQLEDQRTFWRDPNTGVPHIWHIFSGNRRLPIRVDVEDFWSYGEYDEAFKAQFAYYPSAMRSREEYEQAGGKRYDYMVSRAK